MGKASGGVKLQVMSRDAQRAKEIVNIFNGWNDTGENQALLPSRYTEWFDELSKKWPWVGKWDITFRFIVFITVVISLLVIALFFMGTKMSY